LLEAPGSSWIADNRRKNKATMVKVTLSNLPFLILVVPDGLPTI
jgi:hypothetical protein